MPVGRRVLAVVASFFPPRQPQAAISTSSSRPTSASLLQPSSSSPPSAGKQDLTLRPLQIAACGLLPMVCAGMDPRSGDWGLDFIPLVCASGRASLGHAAAMLALGRDLGMARLVSYLGVPFLLHPFLCSVKFV